MKKTISLFLLFPLAVFCQITDNIEVGQNNGNLKFIENKNQWEKNVLYKADLNTGEVFLEKNNFTFVFKDMKAISKLLSYKTAPFKQRSALIPSDYNVKCHAYKLHFLNAKQDAVVSAEKSTKGYSNYFTGNDPARWATNVKSYGVVNYKNLYEKIDLSIYEKDLHLKYDFIVHPGANVENIQMEFEGADNLSLNDGNLIIKTSVNEVTELSPVAFQYTSSGIKNIPCRFQLSGNVLSFVFTEGYDRSIDLIIDPVLIFSTYSGSTTDNWGFTSTFDSQGNVYSGGIAFGTGYPITIGAFQTNFATGICDIAITKYNPIGTQILWSTYLGGSKNELTHSMIVNDLNELVIYGTTGSSNFPVTSNGFDTTFNGGDSIVYDYVLPFNQGIDLFVSKISSDGSQLNASTYIGGTKNDGLNYPSSLSKNYGDGARGEILTDANNNVYVVSTTNSTNFPVTSESFQPLSGGGQDGCIFKLDATLSNLNWSSYLGGSGQDAVYGIILDENDNLFVTGGTTSLDFPITSESLQTNYNGSIDGFITKIDLNGTDILRSTYLGSNSYDQSYFIKLDQIGDVYVYGQTADTLNMFIHNASWYTPLGGQFISKISPNLDSLIWSTNFGTGDNNPDISPSAFQIDLCNTIYLSGWGGSMVNGFGGTSGLPISSNAYQSTTDGNDFYFLVLKDDASELVYGTFFGGTTSFEHVDGGTSRFDNLGRLYQGVCGGCGGNDDFPTTPGVWSQTNNSSNCNNAVIKFDFQTGPVLAIANVIPTDTGCIHYNYHFVNSSNGLNYIWNFGDGSPLSSEVSPYHTYLNQGIYYASLIAVDPSKCNGVDSTLIKIVVMPLPFVDLGDDTCTESITLDAGSGSGYIYNWSTGETSQTINVYNSGIFSVKVSTGIDSHCTASDTITVSIFQKPEFTNINELCENDTLELTLAGTYVSYLWSNNTSASTLKVTTTGTYSVTVWDEHFCMAKDSLEVTFHELPQPVIGGDTVSCNGTPITLDAGSYDSYLWSDLSTSRLFSTLVPGIYSVAVTNIHGCVGIDSIHAYFYEIPATPTITQNGSILVSSSDTGNQWYLNGTPIPGANSQNYPCITNGNYHVVVTSEYGCSSQQSDVVHFIETNIDTFELSDLRIYPNPAGNRISIQTGSENTNAVVSIHDILGRIVLTEKITGKISNIDISALSRGKYFVKISSKDNVIIGDFIKD